MSLRRPSVFGFLAVALALVFAPAVAVAQEDFGFMPKGGKALLQTIAPTPDALRAIGGAKRSEDEWRDWIAARKTSLADRDVNELSAYLAINTPLKEVLPAAGDAAALIAAFPADGRELAWNQCQSCHSLFSGYLMQSRDAQGWRSVFLSPFHREIKMTAQERETFARYSAYSMPMKAEDVPPDLRF